LEQKLSLTLEAPLPILRVPQEQLHFAKQKLHFDEIDTAHAFKAVKLQLHCKWSALRAVKFSFGEVIEVFVHENW